jgi:hypothetical protein
MDTVLDFDHLREDVKGQQHFRSERRTERDEEKWGPLAELLHMHRQAGASCLHGEGFFQSSSHKKNEGEKDSQVKEKAAETSNATTTSTNEQEKTDEGNEDAQAIASRIFARDFVSITMQPLESVYFLIYYWHRLWPHIKRKHEELDSSSGSRVLPREAIVDVCPIWEDFFDGESSYSIRLFEWVEKQMFYLFSSFAELDEAPLRLLYNEERVSMKDTAFFTVHDGDIYYGWPTEALAIYHSEPHYYDTWEQYFTRFFYPVLCFRMEMHHQKHVRAKKSGQDLQRSSADDVRDYLSSMLITHKLFGNDMCVHLDAKEIKKQSTLPFQKACACIFHMLVSMDISNFDALDGLSSDC